MAIRAIRCVDAAIFLHHNGLLLMSLPTLNQALHLFIFVINVVHDLLRELFKSIDKVVGAVCLVYLSELRHFLLTNARDDARLGLHISVAVHGYLLTLASVPQTSGEARLSLVGVIV